MTKVSCTRKFHICFGHRVLNHESKCKNIHGHNYTIFVTASAEHLDSIGRVIDFSEIKLFLGKWLETHFDHGLVLFYKDKDLIDMLGNTDHKLYLMPTNPTAENIAIYLLETICPTLFKDRGITITKIVVHETDNCSAEASL